jgi:pimeloyl-ACP methyl ester carboxylesterase
VTGAERRRARRRDGRRRGRRGRRLRLRLIRLWFGTLGRVLPPAAAGQAERLFSTPRRLARPAWEEQLRRTGTPVTVAGGLAATAWGEGPVVVLLHGWEGRGTQLGTFVGPLVEAGRRVLALDGPAHGASPGRTANPMVFARALLDVAAEVGPLEAVVGHSMGAAAAGLAVARGLPVDRVVMIAGPASFSHVIERFEAAIALPPRASARLRALLARRAGAAPGELDIARLMRSSLRVPALVVHDPDDPEVPFSEAEAIVGAWPEATLLRTSGLGHRRLLRDPETVGAAVAFVTGARPAA